MKKLLGVICVVLLLGACASASLPAQEATVLTPGTYARPTAGAGETATPAMPTLDATATAYAPELLATHTPSVELLVTPTPERPSDLSTPTPPADASLTTPTAPAAAPTQTPPPSTPWAESETVVFLRAKVAEAFGVPSAALTPLLLESASWRDSSLGCPQQGMQYLQVLSEGWRVVFSDETGKLYEIHATQNLSQVVFCDEAQIGRLDDASVSDTQK